MEPIELPGSSVFMLFEHLPLGGGLGACAHHAEVPESGIIETFQFGQMKMLIRGHRNHPSRDVCLLRLAASFLALSILSRALVTRCSENS